MSARDANFTVTLIKNMSFAFYANYMHEWDMGQSLLTINTFFEKWKPVVALATFPYEGDDCMHKWCLCVTTALMVRRVTTL